MRDAALWGRIETADLGPVEALNPDHSGMPATGRGLGASAAALTATSVSQGNPAAKGPGWSLQRPEPLSVEVKTAIMLEAKRFLYLLAVSREGLVPSVYVAAALTQFFDQCDGLVRGLGLGPLTFDPPTAHWRQGKALSRTLALRGEEFGIDDPEHVWPKALSQRLQDLGWGALVVGFGLIAMDRFGEEGTLVWGLPFLALGGFLWATEGPWPWDLPFRQCFVARLGA